ncbi:hypothetical protein KIPB_001723 [Kipferlia bialata]|uniref:Uncharacterized protein n=1 Tax=Kipferlia bialata TaxID=797122 RepID=A0A9K3CQR5_9EUKA|nr:hypothetical protein KIPB_001720 [Kipferlia bialata]GIQ80856.1 hypothetical protein KIPB_001723 [Kipferlia bialata]|eukprot:g1720.t1
MVTTWDDIGLLSPTLPDSDSSAQCGYALAVSDSWLVTGCVGQDEYRGAVAVYASSDTAVSGWVEHTILTPPASTPTSDGHLLFGVSVAVHGDSIAVGCTKEAVNDVPDQGAVYVYSLNTHDEWEREGHIRMPEETDVYFGQEVALSDDYLVVSSRTGLYVSVRDEDGDWGAAVAVPTPNNMYWGAGKLAYEGNILCVGTAYNGSPTSGGSKVVIYDTSVADWYSADGGYMQYIATPLGFNGRGSYGNALSLDEAIGGYPNTLVVAEYESDVLGTTSGGLVHEYRRTEGFFVCENTISHGPVTSETLEFGWKVAIGGDSIAVAGHAKSDYVSIYRMDTRIPQYIPVLLDWEGDVTSLALSSDGETVYIGTDEGVAVTAPLSLQLDSFAVPTTMSRCASTTPATFTLLDVDGDVYTGDMTDSLQVYWDCDADLGSAGLHPVTFMGPLDDDPYTYSVELTAPSAVGTQSLSVYINGQWMASSDSEVVSSISSELSSVDGGAKGGEESTLSITILDTCGSAMAGLDVHVTITDSVGYPVYTGYTEGDTTVSGVYDATLPPLDEGVYTVVATELDSAQEVSGDIYICLDAVSDTLHLSATSSVSAPASAIMGDTIEVSVALNDVETGGYVQVFDPVVLSVGGSGATYRLYPEARFFVASFVVTETGPVNLSVYVGGGLGSDPLLSTTVDVQRVPDAPTPIGEILGWGLFVVCAIYIVGREVYLRRRTKGMKYGEMVSGGLSDARV